MSAQAFRDPATDSAALVFAMCHEISNLVAAMRLQAHLLDEELDARGLAVASLEIDDLSARTASLLALVRPVLTEPLKDVPPIAAGVIALGFERALTEYGERGFEIVFEIDGKEFHNVVPIEVVRVDPHGNQLAANFTTLDDVTMTTLEGLLTGRLRRQMMRQKAG